jgi:integrase
MANIRPRRNKDGVITSYQIRVFKGTAPDGTDLKPYTTSFKPDPNKTDRQNEKALNKFAVEFEEKCRLGLIADNRQTFAEYAEYVIGLKERAGVKHSTILNYRMFLPLINENIGHMKIADIRPQHLNNFYETLSKNGIRRKQGKATAKRDIKAMLKQRNLTVKKAAELAGIGNNTLSTVCNGGAIVESKAQAIADLLEMPVNKLFKVKHDNTPFSNKTILEYHRFISTVLEQADKELLIPYNPARKATPPKAKTHNANYFQIEDIERIRDCLEKEPIKWKTIVHLLLITGARRGEIAGLKWDIIDWDNNRIHICNNLLYAPDWGIYEESTKTVESDRFVALPVETMELLKEYRKWYLMQAKNYGDQWHNTNYLFFQERTGNIGKPMHPDTINGYLDSFSQRYNLPHINPHAFRHTMASVLYFNNIDSISISKRLGHSKVSTTTDIYSHIMKEADRNSAECIADVILRPHTTDISERKAE